MNSRRPTAHRPPRAAARAPWRRGLPAAAALIFPLGAHAGHAGQDLPSAQLWLIGLLCVGVLAVLLHLFRKTLFDSRRGMPPAFGNLPSPLLPETLEVERARFDTLFALTPVPVSIVRLSDGAHLDVNAAWERASGWSRDEIFGRTTLDINGWVSETERTEYLAALKQDRRIENRPVRFRLRNGEIRHFLSQARIIDHQQTACIFSAYTDLTEQLQSEARLLELNASLEQRVSERTAELEQANASLESSLTTLRQTRNELAHLETMASLGSMVAGISHELNTPLGNALTLGSSLHDQVQAFRRRMHEGPLTRSALDEFLDDLDQGGGLLTRSLERAAELVTSFKQVAVDQSSERRRRFMLDELVNDVLNTLRPSLRHRPVELKVLLDKGITMDSYPGPLGQVVVNLVQNAVIHGLADTPQGSVRIEALLAEGEIELRVADNGCGISAEHLPRIFDPFFTTRLGSGGSGLGLSIVHRIVTTVLGGSIRVSSQPGEGTGFRIRLPLTAPDAASPAAEDARV